MFKRKEMSRDFYSLPIQNTSYQDSSDSIKNIPDSIYKEFFDSSYSTPSSDIKKNNSDPFESLAISTLSILASITCDMIETSNQSTSSFSGTTSTPISSKQCKAFTAQNKQCKRNCIKEELYCATHYPYYKFDCPNDCCICSESMNQSKDQIKPTKCGHWMHTECLQTWLKTKRTCPICRTVLKQKSKSEKWKEELEQLMNIYRDAYHELLQSIS